MTKTKPTPTKRLVQLQADVQRVLFMVDDDSADPLQMFRLLQAALDRNKEGSTP